MAQSWFADPELLTTNLSVSYLPGNLSKADDTLAYAHTDDVVVVNVAASPCAVTKLPITEKSCIHQVRLCSLQGTTFIIVASDNGVQIFDAKGKKRLYELALKDALDATDDAARVRSSGVAVFCRGIAAIDVDQPMLVVGTSLGKLLVLGVSNDQASAKATDGDATHTFELRETLRDHKDAAVTWVESSPSSSSSLSPLVASSDESGLLLVRNAVDAFDVVFRVTNDDAFPVTCMCFVADSDESQSLVTGDLTGKLRIYKRQDGSTTLQLYAEVAAHTRAITALAARESQFASVGDDTFLNVWDVAGSNNKDAKATRSNGNNSRVQLMSSHAVRNDLLTGVAFAGAKRILTTAYDTTHVKLWVPE